MIVQGYILNSHYPLSILSIIFFNSATVSNLFYLNKAIESFTELTIHLLLLKYGSKTSKISISWKFIRNRISGITQDLLNQNPF